MPSSSFAASHRVAPRVAGRRLQVIAALMKSPMTGRRLARLMLQQMGLGAFRRERERAEHLRPAVVFRAAPRPPNDLTRPGEDA